MCKIPSSSSEDGPAALDLRRLAVGARLKKRRRWSSTPVLTLAFAQRHRIHPDSPEENGAIRSNSPAALL